MLEVPRRLTPTAETVRELYLKSGNECAYPNCTNRIINREGIFIGELCHIEAALPGGERFNAMQTNEERRSFENLSLLCREHHVITNDVTAFPVARMRQIKAEHEARFTDIVRRIRASFIDHTATANPIQAGKGERLNAVLEWHLSQEHLAETVAQVNDIAARLQRVPRSTREFLTIVIQRGQRVSSGPSYSIRALHHDIVEACETDDDTVIKHVQILESHNFGYGDENDGIPEIVIRGQDWPFWIDMKLFAERTDTPLRELLVEGRFDLLD